jgi:hypothetical protein
VKVDARQGVQRYSVHSQNLKVSPETWHPINWEVQIQHVLYLSLIFSGSGSTYNLLIYVNPQQKMSCMASESDGEFSLTVLKGLDHEIEFKYLDKNN